VSTTPAPTTDATYADAVEREIVLTRVFAAPRSAVWAAWVGDDIGSWFGPAGFTCTTFERDVRPGGQWRFEMVGPDGTVYPNLVAYREVVPESKLVFDHGDGEDASRTFLVTVTLDEQADGKTVLTMRQLQPTREARDATIGFGAVELGLQTLGKLAASLGVE